MHATEAIGMSDVQIEEDIHWDGQKLSVWIVALGNRICCDIPRDTIHRIRLYSDAITREIERDKNDIVDRLLDFISAKATATNQLSFELRPTDLPAGI
jgi:hypothetical protein